MKKYIFGDRIGTSIDFYALILTLLVLGGLLRFGCMCIVSEIITTIIEKICLCLSSLLLIYKGTKLKGKRILGISEMAFGATALYVMSSVLPTTNNINIFFFIGMAFYLFNFIGGLLAFIYSLVDLWFSKTSDNFSKTESIVASITSIFVTLFAGIQLFM